jgi:hypothetical protein
VLKYEFSKGKYHIYTNDNLPVGHIYYSMIDGQEDTFKFVPYTLFPHLHDAWFKLEAHLPVFNTTEPLQYLVLGMFMELGKEVEA